MKRMLSDKTNGNSHSTGMGLGTGQGPGAGSMEFSVNGMVVTEFSEFRETDKSLKLELGSI